MNTFDIIKKFLDKNPDMKFVIELEPESIDSDEKYYVWLQSKKDGVIACNVHGSIFDNIDANIVALIETAKSIFKIID